MCPYEFVETGLVTVTVKRCSTLNDACLAGCIHSLSLDRMPVKNRFVSVFRLTRRATVTWRTNGKRGLSLLSLPSIYIYTCIYVFTVKRKRLSSELERVCVEVGRCGRLDSDTK